MAPTLVSETPGVATLLKIVASEPIETSQQLFISLLKRRQIHGSKACAVATAYLLRRAISLTRASEPGRLLQRVQDVGRQIQDAAPRELSIGNIVRRVLGLIRDEEDENKTEILSGVGSDAGSLPATPYLEGLSSGISSMSSSTTITAPRGQDATVRPPLVSSHTTPGQTRPVTSMFSILSHPTMQSGTTSPTTHSGTSTPNWGAPQPASIDLRAEILEGIAEIIDELDQAEEQVANYALEHIQPTETIITYSSSVTVQRFLLKAASKRRFTVVHAEGYPNAHSQTHSLVTGNSALTTLEKDAGMGTDAFQKPLINAGITVLLIPDNAIFAMMSRTNKVILSAHSVLSNGSVIASAGTQAIVKAAKFHRVPVIVLAETYKLSPVFPHDPHSLIEYGDVSTIIPYQDAEMRNGLSGVRNPLNDFVEASDIDLFVTNVGSVATGYLYRTIRDQYREEDVELSTE